VLFLDEAPEFAPRVLDALRQPLESGVITVARVGFTTQLPSRFQLVLAANPCPCGHAGAQSEVQCTCSASQQRRYLARLSGPLLDRVDIRLVLAKPTPAELAFDDQRGEASAVVAGRVQTARERMLRRFTGTPWRVNAEVPGVELRRRLSLKGDAVDALEAVLRHPSASARGVDRIVRIAQTVADLGGREQPSARDINHAAALRDASGQWAA
jgi:magnesium chelatase family protein